MCCLELPRVSSTDVTFQTLARTRKHLANLAASIRHSSLLIVLHLTCRRESLTLPDHLVSTFVLRVNGSLKSLKQANVDRGVNNTGQSEQTGLSGGGASNGRLEAFIHISACEHLREYNNIYI